ncbi:MAG: GAF domain-containing protein [Pseudolysinimonas sp.]
MPDPLGFPDAPRSELERTIEELVERAQTVLSTQGRLRSLLAANRAVVEDLDLEKVLRRIAEAAVTLVGAEYGALGVISPDGQLEQFIHVGMPVALAKKIGHLPEGHGLLGAVIDQAQTIRLEHLGDDPRSAGFPAHHPAMEAFLGVPIRVRDEVFGNLYLTNPQSARFTSEDEELVTALAATAGIAIENARLFDDSRRRQRWSSALADVTSALLSGAANDVLEVIAALLAVVIEADLVCVIVPGTEPETLLVEVARGSHADDVRGRVYAANGTVAGRALASGQITAVDGQAADELFEGHPALGPTIALPLLAAGNSLGVLTISRAPGASKFATSDLEMAAEFASQTGVAIELTRARADRQRLELSDERSRIARDLHDHVIQRLFGTGLALQALAGTDPRHQTALLEQVDAIDAAISEIRTAVFALSQRRRTDSGSLRHRVLDTAGEVAASLEQAPRLTFAGPVDILIRDDFADDVVAVIRESLANVARHAKAHTVEVEIATDGDTVTITVDDDGIGVPDEPTRSSGTANLRERAEARGGSFTLARRDTGGSRVLWVAEVPSTERPNP